MIDRWRQANRASSPLLSPLSPISVRLLFLQELLDLAHGWFRLLRLGLGLGLGALRGWGGDGLHRSGNGGKSRGRAAGRGLACREWPLSVPVPLSVPLRLPLGQERRQGLSLALLAELRANGRDGLPHTRPSEDFEQLGGDRRGLDRRNRPRSVGWGGGWGRAGGGGGA
jgi:hypothetical protein